VPGWAEVREGLVVIGVADTIGNRSAKMETTTRGGGRGHGLFAKVRLHLAKEQRPMTIPIRRAAVIGGGVMGSGIAAHLANAGVRVLLLDIVPPDLKPEEKSDKKARDRFA